MKDMKSMKKCEEKRKEGFFAILDERVAILGQAKG
jgi:hypothetical protein